MARLSQLEDTRSLGPLDSWSPDDVCVPHPRHWEKGLRRYDWLVVRPSRSFIVSGSTAIVTIWCRTSRICCSLPRLLTSGWEGSFPDQSLPSSPAIESLSLWSSQSPFSIPSPPRARTGQRRVSAFLVSKCIPLMDDRRLNRIVLSPSPAFSTRRPYLEPHQLPQSGFQVIG